MCHKIKVSASVLPPGSGSLIFKLSTRSHDLILIPPVSVVNSHVEQAILNYIPVLIPFTYLVTFTIRYKNDQDNSCFSACNVHHVDIESSLQASAYAMSDALLTII